MLAGILAGCGGGGDGSANPPSPLTAPNIADVSEQTAGDDATATTASGDSPASGDSLSNPPSPIIPQISAGGGRTYAINSAGQLFGWGDNSENRLGLGNLGNSLPSVSAPALLTGNDWEQVSASGFHTCAINASGHLFCWGNNFNGQLGLSNNNNTNTPTQVGGASNWMQVSAGGTHTCAINTSGYLFCWGGNFDGRLGLSNNNNTNTLTRVVGASNWAQVSGGGSHTCAINASGQLFCWGNNFNGQLGLRNHNNTNKPTQVGGDSGDSDWMQVSAGDSHTCATKASGQLFCWGNGGSGRLGLRNNNNTNTPTQVGGDSGDSDWMQVSAGDSHTCATKASGQLFCWGNGGSGRLGLRNNNNTNTPTQVGGDSGDSDWMQVSAGGNHTCATKASGQLFCWGNGGSGRLGLGSNNTSANAPTLVPGIPLKSMVGLSLTLHSNVGLPFAIANIGGSLTTCTATPTIAGGDALASYNLTVRVAGGTCVIDSLDGNGPSRTLDGGSFTITASSGATTTLTLNPRSPIISQISAGGSRTYAINSTRQLFGWGDNLGNLLGLGNSGNSLNSISTPTLLTGNNWEQVSGNQNHTCAINASGQLFCWGSNFGRQRQSSNDINTPTQVGSANNWMQVSAGTFHTCAINASGQLFCWGNGGSQLGLGNSFSSRYLAVHAPTLLTGNDWAQVSAGGSHTCAIKASGQLWCWGNGGSGRLGLGNNDNDGDGYNDNVNTPVRVVGASNWAQVKAGNEHTCAINASGQLFCWGNNFNGQLGLRNNSNTNTPTQVGGVSGDSDWMQVSAGGNHTCATKASGQLFCWGSGGNGQLGLGNNNGTNRPRIVGIAIDWMQVSAGAYHTCATKASGQLFCWGNGGSGRLGLGSNTSTNTPTLVPGILVPGIALKSMVELGLTLNSNVGLPFAIANIGGSLTTCTATPTIAGGDALDSYNLTVLVADGTCVIDSLDGNGPSKTLDGGSFTITPSSGATSTLTLNLRSPVSPQIVAGNGRTYAINSARQLFGWGNNYGNRLGLGNSGNSLNSISTPTLLTANDWEQVSADGYHTCAIKSSGKLFCWGGNYDGQLGLGDNNIVDTPTKVGSASNWAQVSAGNSYTCAIKSSGKLFCWGRNYDGQLGLGDNFDTNTPTQVGGDRNWMQVSAGGAHTCAINTSGQLFCWGYIAESVLRVRHNAPNTPTQVGSASDWMQVNTSNSHTCAIKSSGKLFCWGGNHSGQLGLGDNSRVNTPRIVGSANNWAQVSTGNSYTCAIKSSGKLFCWGRNYNGQLGLGDNNRVNIPTKVGSASNWAQVNAGNAHTCAINTSGQPFCWGNGANGQLGLGSNTSTDTPTLVPDIALKSMVELGLTLNSNVGLPFAIANTEGSPTTCTAAPTTTGGDALDSYNLTILAAGGTCVIDSLNGKGPSKTLDGGSFTITASNGATTILTLNLRTPATPQISTAGGRTYAINSARQLFGWGSNSENQLGLGNSGNSLNSISTPTLLTGNDWAQASAGRRHTCAINSSGELWCWGFGGSGRLGLGNDSSTNTPTQVGSAGDWVQVNVGRSHTCAIKESGQLFCWGYGGSGRLGLGLGYNGNTNTPAQAGSGKNWMQVSAGGFHTCAIDTSRQLFCWGDNFYGQLGLGYSYSTNTTPTQVGGASGDSDWMQVSAGKEHTCAIKTSGQLWCWGSGGSGRLGLGNDNSTNIPTQVGGDSGDSGDSDWMQVSAGEEHTCAIKTSGQLWCWGSGGNGRLGLGDNSNTDTPTQVGGTSGDSNWMQVSAGSNHTCAIKASGQLFCWGEGATGQLGLGGSNTSANTPALVPGIPLKSMVELGLTLNSNVGLPFAIANTEGSPTTCTAAPTIAGGDTLASYNLTVLAAGGTCVIDSLNGKGPSKTLDEGSFTITASNGATTTLTLNLRSPATPQISAGGDRTYAINSARQLFGWGSNSENQLGLGNSGNSLNSISTPTLLTGNDWAQASAGRRHTCAINSSGELWCWGFGGSGRLGLGNDSSTNTPTQVGSAGDWVQVNVGRSHTCAIKESGQLFCWGYGGSGRLGLGLGYNRNTDTPTQVYSTNDWMQVSAGGFHTCAIDSENKLFCWGNDGSGRLGLGDNGNTDTPTQVGGASGDSDWMQVSAGKEHTCAIKISGQLWCWGSGGSGRLGLGNDNSTNIPTQVGGDSGDSNWMQVSTGKEHTCAIKTSGQLLCWGSGGNGRLGLGNDNSTNTPTQVGGAKDWIQVGAGGSHTCATKASGQLLCWGEGATGRLGLGSSNTSTNTPTLVPDIALKSMVKLGLTLNSNVGLPFAIANTGGSPTTCTAAPTSTDGDALASYNLTILAAGGTCVIDSLNGNGPSKTLDGGSFTITASNGATTILTLNLRTPATPQISTGHDRTYAINSARQLFGWGDNSENRLGLGNLGNSLPSVSAPTLLTGNDWAQVSAGRRHTCAINASGKLWCWGFGGSGRLGLGNDSSTNTPTQVDSDNDWMQVNVGRSHTCAINASGKLWCWGFGGSGRLGLGNDSSTNTPTQVDSDNDWMQVSAGGFHTCAIDSENKLFCWGNGGSGRLGLGLGNNTSTHTPTQVGSASNWAQVSAGMEHTCAMNTSKQLWCWGHGANGQLGSGSNGRASIPVRVDRTRDGSANDWMQVSAGNYHTCAIDSEDKLYCWGNGGSGRLGLGNNTSTLTPTQVGSASNWAQVSASSNYTCAMNTSGQLFCWGDGSSGRLGLGSNTSVNTPTLVRLDIIVHSGIVPDSLSARNLFRYEVGRAISNTRQITFTNGGGTIQSCAAPDLPIGMSINNDNCTISGKPSRITADRTTHTITARYTDGTISEVTIFIETYFFTSPSLSNYSGVTLVVDSDVGLPIVLENTGGLVEENGCQVIPNTRGHRPLSDFGLELAVTNDSSSCEIRAVNTAPSATVEETEYRIRATNGVGVSVAVATLRIIGVDDDLPAPTLTAPTGSLFTFATNTAITPIDFTLDGGGLGICTIDRVLPAGLRFDPSTCQISGTPRTASARTTYTVTATNKTAPVATAAVVIRVTNASAPSLERMVELNLTMNSNAGLPFAIANTGGSPTSCAAAPTTTGGDALGSYNLTVLVAGGTCVIDSLDGNGPSRTLDGGSFTITPSSGATTTLTLNLRSPITPQIVTGFNTTYAINSAGQLFGWGNNGVANRLGLGDLGDFLYFISAPALLTGNDWAQVSAGQSHTCAIKTSGQLFCWGYGSNGRLGLGNNDNTNTPTQVGRGRNWMQVSAGIDHTCAINTSGQLRCWGNGTFGRLGMGNNRSAGRPTQVIGTSNWAQVSAGQSHTCAIDSEDKLWCWGFGGGGQLGLGEDDNTNTPTQVIGTSNWAQVSAGTAHTCAIDSEDKLWCWGWGGSGQLGLGEDDNTNTPTQVIGTSNWAQVSAGSSHTCAIDSEDKLWCWGRGGSGQLGLGEDDNTNTPTQVGEASDWMQVSASRSYTCAMNTSGQLWCWGFGGNAELGLGDRASTNIPALVRGAPFRPDIIVNPVAPSLQALDAQSYPTNASVNVELVNYGGGELKGCSVNNSLPNGLSVTTNAGNDSCVITGTPDIITNATDFEITATNATGSSAATVSIAVVSGVASFETATPGALVYAVGDIVNKSFANTNIVGSRVSDCAPTSTLPAGLSIDAIASPGNGCALTGIATTIATQANYTVTVSNDNGHATLTLDITVNPAAPNLSAVNAQVYAINATITALVFTNTGGDVTASTGCTVDTSGGKPNLPTDLNVGVVSSGDKRTCQITGTPEEVVSPARMVTITATNVTGFSTVTVPIIVNSGIVPDSLSAQNLFRYEAGRTVSNTRQITFTNLGGTIRSCIADLPDGMSINSTNCAISGKPSRITAETTTHIITARYTDDTISAATISIETYLSAPPSLSDYSSVTLVADSTVGLPIVLENTGGLVGDNGCQVISNTRGHRPLSYFGLELAVTNGNSSCEIRAINAVPAATVEKTEYRIRATNDLGVSGTVVTFRIIGASDPLPAPTLTAPAGSPFTFATNTAITPIDFTLGDVGLGICTIDQALPAGLRFDPSTCQISGTPRTASARTTYTVTATNKTAPVATATAAITVTNAAAPSLERMIDLNLTMNSNAGLPFTIANTGGSPTTCTATPTTASDDALKSYNLTVLVADGTCVIDSLDGNGPSRTLDGGGFTITASTASSSATATLTLNLHSLATPQIAAGSSRTYAINSAGQLFGWGNNDANRLGLGDLKDFLNPISAPALLTGNNWEQVSSSQDHTCAIKASGQLWCWGWGGSGRLGLGNNDNTNTPTRVGDASNWMQVSAGRSHTCAINASGQLWCWGVGRNGRLGLGHNNSTNTPKQVSNDSNWMQISAGRRFTCATKTSGQLFCWGFGGSGQLGLSIGNGRDFNTPKQVGRDRNWMQVSAGEEHACAINASGQLRCWGYGANGQLGLGNNNSVNTPTQVGGASGDSDWMQVSAGSIHTCAIKTSGQLWCWGSGGNGRLGLDNNDNTHTPTQVGGASGDSDWMQVSAGEEHTCAMNTSGQLFCWGNGSSGRLGLGNNANTNTPTLVRGIPLRLDITVNPAAPSLQALGGQSYPTGALVNVALINAGGGKLTECTVNNTLPSGLSVARNTGNDSCEITGTPYTVTPAADFEITATNATGSSVATVSIAVVSGVASFETATPGALVYAVGDIVNKSFANTNIVGSRVSDCAPTSTLPAGLSIDAIASPGNGCALTGIATTIATQANYTVTVSNDNGRATLTLDITVNPAAPSLQALGGQSYPTGAPVNVALMNTGGGELSECTVNNTLPNGLSVARNTGNDSCEITGTPDTVTPAADFEITATNATGSSAATVSIAVVSGVASFETATPGALVYAVGDIVNKSFANTNAAGSRVSDCAPTSTLPAGLSIDAIASPGNGCALTGRATTIATQANYTVTVSNDNGRATLTLDITVNPAAPSLQAPDPVERSYPTGAPVSVELTNAGGGKLTECTVNNTLPNGLSVARNTGNDSCEITGTPDTVTPAADFEITATNITGSSLPVTVSIAVISGVASFATPRALVYAVGDIVNKSFANTNAAGSRVSACAVPTGDTLPAGLSIDAIASPGNGCALTGRATTIATQANYTVTVSNDNGRATLTLDITVNPAVPSLQALGGQSYPTGALVNVALMNTGGGELSECTVNNTLPSGLIVARNTGNDSCEITGTPDTVTPAADFEITATNATGSSAATVSIAVISGVASFATPGALVYAVGDIVNKSFANTNAAGSRVSACVGPTGDTLPAELSIDAIASPGNGCVLTGTPTTITEQASYTITVTNDNGNITLTLDITVNPATPNLQAPDPVERSYPTGAPVSVELTNAGGGKLTECTVNNTLPNGLSVARNTGNDSCEITGTPDTVTPAADFEITATNITGSSLPVTVSIAVISGVASFATPRALVYAVGDIVNKSFANTNAAGSRVSACAVPTGDTLPAGLSIDAIASPGNGCALTGRATTIATQANYTVTVSNDNGRATLTLDITVNPAVPSLQALGGQSYPTGALVNVALMNTGGGELSECTVNNTLPSGLIVARNTGNDSCEITGTPDTVTPAADFEITATNVTGSSTVTVSITVHSGIMPVSLSGQSLFRYEIGRTVPDTRQITFTSADSSIQPCTADLPDGMSINSADCAISGAPSRTTAQTTTHTITAMYMNGTTSTATISIETYLSAPPSLSDYSSVTLVVGSNVGLPIVLENTGGLVGENGCEVISNTGGDRPLSNFGLALAVTDGNSSCEIKVINTAPTATVKEIGYRIRATNDLGVSGAVATLTIIGAGDSPLPAPALTAPAGSPFTFATNTAIAPIVFDLRGRKLGICTIDQALPAGLRFDPSTCQISGTPRTASARTTYTITAINNTSPAATATAAITVTDAAPSLERMVSLNLTMNSNAGLPFAIANTGGSPTSCTPAPTIAGDDALASYNLTTFDAGGTCVIDSLDGNGPSRVLNGGSFTITPSSGATTTLTLNLRTPATPQIVAGGSRTYAINSARQLFGWGSNDTNQLGLGDLKDFLNPVSAPALLTGSDWEQAASSNTHTCAINASGQLWCWGNNLFGRLGLGNESNTDTPTQVGMASNWVQVSAGSNHTCAIKAPGELWCWGNGAIGRLGLGNNSNTDTPTQVGMASNWVQVSAGATHTCAIKALGQLWCWGYGGDGRLGLGDIDNANTPMRVGDEEGWTQVGVGESHTCAINVLGRLWCWGTGKKGQLGLGDIDNANTPTRVGEAEDWMQVGVGESHTCAINVLGQLFCWGVGANDRLGLGDIDNANTPTRVGEAEDWMQVGSGNEHTCSIKTSGQLFCWGNGANGRLGLGSNVSKDTPTRVPGILLQ